MADVSGTRELVRRHAARIAAAAADTIRDDLADRASTGRGFGVSGDTARSVSVRQRSSGDVIGYRAEATTPQATFREEGTRPHTIRARNAPVLRFFWPKVGRVVFFKQVNHPGNRPMPWFGPAVRRWSQALADAARNLA